MFIISSYARACDLGDLASFVLSSCMISGAAAVRTDSMKIARVLSSINAERIGIAVRCQPFHGSLIAMMERRKCWADDPKDGLLSPVRFLSVRAQCPSYLASSIMLRCAANMRTCI